MLTLYDNTQVYLCLDSIDMRKSINGLSAIILDDLNQHPQSGSLFIFLNKKKDKVKIIWWDKNGFVLHYKRLEKSRFKLPKALNKGTIEITENQLNWLLAGLDFMLMNEFSHLNYEHYY